jgi:biopolymer transport protein ExbD
MINIKGKKDYLVALESVAMTDIVLNMFIFFFISFSLIYTFNPVRMSKIDVKLPKASTAVALEGSEKIVLAITKEGLYFVDDTEIKETRIRAAIEERLRENAGLRIVLKVDRLTEFDNVVEVLDILNALNIQNISIAAIGPVTKNMVKNDEGAIK